MTTDGHALLMVDIIIPLDFPGGSRLPGQARPVVRNIALPGQSPKIDTRASRHP